MFYLSNTYDGDDLRFCNCRHQLMLRDHGYRAIDCALRDMAVYYTVFAVTRYNYPRKDGQAELTWMAGYIVRWFTRLQTFTHSNTNQARRTATYVDADQRDLPLSQTRAT